MIWIVEFIDKFGLVINNLLLKQILNQGYIKDLKYFNNNSIMILHGDMYFLNVPKRTYNYNELENNLYIDNMISRFFFKFNDYCIFKQTNKQTKPSIYFHPNCLKNIVNL